MHSVVQGIAFPFDAEWYPVDELTRHSPARPSAQFVNFAQQGLLSTDSRYAVHDLQKTSGFQSPQDVFFGHRSLPNYVLEGEGLSAAQSQVVHQSLRPPRQIGFLAQIRKRFLGSACLALDEAELIAEGDEELAVAFSLVVGQDEDAGEVKGGVFGLSGRALTLEKYPARWYSRPRISVST